LGLAVISYDRPEILAAFSQQRGITFPLLSDAGSTTIKAFGILNPAAEWALGPDKDDPAIAADIRKYVSGGGANAGMVGMAFPGTFVLDRAGRVTSRLFEDFYVERATVSSVLAKLGAATPPVTATKISNAQIDITTFPSDAAVAPGNHFSLIFDVVPRPGIHVYAPGASSYRVISVTIRPQPFVVVPPMQYPAAEIYFFEPLNERVPVFQKPFRLIQGVLVEGTAQAQAALQGRESLTITGSLEYQACDDKACFNPATVPVAWTLTLRPLIRERPTLPR
jgi:peroxiredoxin